MRALVSVASLEIARRWTLLPVALALGVATMGVGAFGLAPLFGVPASETRLIGLLFSFQVATLTAIVLGASVIAGDLGAGRLSFFFSRPLPWWAIWGGKTLAALVLTVLAGLLATLPWMFVGWDASPTVAVFALGLTLFVIGAAQLATVAFRARSAWLAADLVLLAGTAWLYESVGRRILEAGTVFFGPRGDIAWLVWPPAVALLVAGAVQVACGRTDLARGHRAASLTFWPLLLVVPVGFTLQARWLAGVTPRDLASAYILTRAPNSDWAGVVGAGRGAARWDPWTTLLVDGDSGRFLRVSPSATLGFSADGAHAAWLTPNAGHDGAVRWTLTTLRLTGVAALPREVPLTPAPPVGWPRLVVGREGRRVAVVQDAAISVYDGHTGGREAFAAFPGEKRPLGALFVDESRLRAYRTAADGIDVLEVGVPGTGAEVVGHADAAGGTPVAVRLEASGRRFFAFSERPAGLALHDARTGARLLSLPVGGPGLSRDAAFLEDGRLAIAETDGRVTRLRFLSPDGHDEGGLELGPARSLSLVEAAPRRLVVGLTTFAWGPAQLVVVDTEARRALRVEEGLRYQHSLGERFALPEAAQSHGAVLVEAGEQVFRYDVESGRRTLVTGRRGS